jgi:plastocyanin
MKRSLAIVAPLALAIGLAACSTASTQPSAPAGSPAAPAAGTVRIVAKDIAFQAPSGTAAAGSPFDIDFVNQDGVPHNVELYDANGAEVFKGDMISGGEVTYHVKGLGAGAYRVKCVVHQDMDQTLTVQ